MLPSNKKNNYISKYLDSNCGTRTKIEKTNVLVRKTN